MAEDAAQRQGSRAGAERAVPAAPDRPPGDRKPAARRRLAAVVAVLALLGALASAVLWIAHAGVLRLVASLLAMVCATIGLWYVVARRGVRRWIGLGVVVASVVAIVLVAVLAGRANWFLLLAAGVVGLSTAASRYALGRDPATLRAAGVPGGRSVERPRRPVLLMNPKSGGGKVGRFHLVEECRRRRIEPVVLSPGDDLRWLANDAVDRGADVIGMAGGDGSQALVASVAAERNVPHVCVPAGTRNHFALDLGLDREDVVGALGGFAEGAVERRVDLARVNGRVFVNNASLGLYAKVVQSPAYRDAKVETAAQLLPEMLGPDAEPFDLRFAGPDGKRYGSAHLVLVANGPYELDQLAGLGTRARLDDGALGVLALRVADARHLVRLLAAVSAGRVRDFPDWLEWSVPTFEVDAGGPIEIGIDGEALRLDPPLRFESLPGALRVRVPANTRGYTPASTAVRLSPSLVGELAGVAAGRPVVRAPPD